MSRDRLKVLVVDDEAAMREVLEMRLKQWGFEVVLAKNAAEARAIAEERAPDAVISDLVLPDSSGLDLVESLLGSGAHRPVIMITAHGAVDIAVEAMKLGAMDFLTKPIDYEKLKATLVAAKHELERRDRAHHLEQTLAEGGGLGLLVGDSKPMREVYELFSGRMSVEDVLGAARGEPSRQAMNLFYAELYVGLYLEAIGQGERAREHLVAAADAPVGGYMRDVARVHLGRGSPSKE